MKKTLLPLMKKVGERTAQVPIDVRCWPYLINQPKMPDSLRAKMKERDKK